MPDNTSLSLMTDEQWPVVEQLWQLYQHDLSEFRGTLPNDAGRFKPGRLPTYADDPDTCGYLIRGETALAGFAIVHGLSRQPKTLAEFFVVRAARRRRIGRAAALAVLARHPGSWEIAFQEENPAAARFWRGIAAIAAVSSREERRPVPGKPAIPPDVWLTLTVANGGTIPPP